MPFSETLLPEFDAEMKNTRKLLECVPDGKFDFQPHPKSMTLGRLATHVAELPAWAKMVLSAEVTEIPADFNMKSRNPALSYWNNSTSTPPTAAPPSLPPPKKTGPKPGR